MYDNIVNLVNFLGVPQVAIELLEDADLVRDGVVVVQPGAAAVALLIALKNVSTAI